jgi:hypothetical protein
LVPRITRLGRLRASDRSLRPHGDQTAHPKGEGHRRAHGPAGTICGGGPHADCVTAVYVFGSDARGALNVGDVDTDIEYDARLDPGAEREMLDSPVAGRDWNMPFRKALKPASEFASGVPESVPPSPARRISQRQVANTGLLPVIQVGHAWRAGVGGSRRQIDRTPRSSPRAGAIDSRSPGAPWIMRTRAFA